VRRPSDQRQRELCLAAFEVALYSGSVNGLGVHADAQWVMQFLALDAPAYAVRLDHVMDAIGAEVATAVRRLAAETLSAEKVTSQPVAPMTSQRRDSTAATDDNRAGVTVAEVAVRTGLQPHAVRAALRRGRLDGTKINGEWVTSLAAIERWRDGATGTRRRTTAAGDPRRTASTQG
jgi:hypothetical protein